jgi:hypothetical protein
VVGEVRNWVDVWVLDKGGACGRSSSRGKCSFEAVGKIMTWGREEVDSEKQMCPQRASLSLALPEKVVVHDTMMTS